MWKMQPVGRRTRRDQFNAAAGLLVSGLVGLATIGGLILLIIPGIYIGVRLAVSPEALVVEGQRGTRAMGRSWELVGGQHELVVQAVVAAVATVITLPYGALIYLDLRGRKEGLTLETLRTDLQTSAA
jgi:hypothetical protein